MLRVVWSISQMLQHRVQVREQRVAYVITRYHRADPAHMLILLCHYAIMQILICCSLLLPAHHAALAKLQNAIAAQPSCRS